VNSKPTTDVERRAKLQAELRREWAERQAGYRAKALRMFPHLCARCGREFSGKRIKELTVHHKDFNHDNNPQDGSNWELLCIYCHDDEHGTDTMRAMGDGAATGIGPGPSPIVDPFAGLGDLIKPKAGEPSS
jgi:5-methylcytosine-specific restriction endonuclease McrA